MDIITPVKWILGGVFSIFMLYTILYFATAAITSAYYNAKHKFFMNLKEDGASHMFSDFVEDDREG